MKSQSSHKKIWIVCSSLILAGSASVLFATTKDYIQLLPLAPMFDPYTPSQNYLSLNEPPSPWKVTPRVPSQEELNAYKSKIEAITTLKNKPEEDKKKAASKVGDFPESNYQPFISIPQFKLNLGDIQPVKEEVTSSPFLPPVQQQQQQQPRNQSQQSQKDDPNNLPWIKKPMGGGAELYLPLNGTDNPPQPVSSSSSVIYTQPESSVGK